MRHRPHQLLVSVSHHAPAFLGEEYPILIEITNADDRDLDVAVDVLLQPTDIDHAGKCPSYNDVFYSISKVTYHISEPHRIR